MPYILGEVEVVNEVSLAPSSVLRDGAVESAGDLTVNVNSFFYDLAGLKGKFNGALCAAVSDNSINYVYLDGSTTLKVKTTGYPVSDIHIRLARVITQSGIIVRIVHERAFFSASSPSLDGYAHINDLQGLVNTELEHTIQSSTVFQYILNDLDGYNQTIQEHYSQHSNAIQTILNELDGYHPDVTGQEHYAQHSEAINYILVAVDGYGNTIDHLLQETVAQADAIQSILKDLDGYALQVDLEGLDQTVGEHYNQYGNALQTILKELDGYHPDITGQDHYAQLSSAIQTILKDLDGYALQTSLSGLDTTVSEHYTQHSQAIQDILASLDGYNENSQELENQVTNIQNSLDGYLTAIEVEDDGSSVGTNFVRFNFTGSGVTASDAGSGEVTVNIPGGVGSDELVKVSSNDTTSGFLNGKLIAGTNITFVENNDGGNETLTIKSNDDDLEKQVTDIQNSLDGYALKSIEDQRWIDSSKQRQNIRDALDGYSSEGSGISVDYYSTVETSFGTTNVTLTLNTTRKSDSAFTLASNEITCNTEGTYRIDYDVALKVEASNHDVTIWLEKNTVEIPGTKGKAMVDTNTGSSSAHGMAILNLVATDVLRIRAISDSTSTESRADGVRLIIHTIGVTGATGPQGPTGSGSNVTVKDEGSLVTGTPHSNLNFTGAGVTVTNEGGGQAKIDIPGGGSGKTVSEDFTKVSHGLSVGNVVRHSGANPEDWVKALADTGDNSEALGVVSAVSGNDFTIVYSGRISGLTGLTANSVHFLSASIAGGLTTTDPTISKPILFSTSTTSAVVLIERGITNGSASTTMRIPHTYAISGEIKVPSGDTDFIIPFFVSLAAGQTAELAKVRHKINSGTSVTCKIQKNGSDVTGFTGISVTTTAADTDPANVTLANNDSISLVVTGVAGAPKNMSFTIFVEYTV